MKNKRLLSLIMSAALTLTSLPALMMPVSAGTEAVDGVETADFVPALINDTDNRGIEVTASTLNTGNKYLSNYHKLGGQEGIKITFATEYSSSAQTYTLTFSARSPLADKQTVRVFVNTGSNRELHNLPGTPGTVLTPSVSDVWSSDYSAEFTVPASTAQYTVSIFSRNDIDSITPMDFDNIVIRKGNASSETVVYSEDFEKCEVGKLGATGWTVYESSGRGKLIPLITYGSEYTISADEPYTRAAENGWNRTFKGNIDLTYSEDLTLVPGEYLLKGTFRNSQWRNDGTYFDFVWVTQGQIINITNELNRFNAYAVISGDGLSLQSPMTEVHNGWTDIEYSFSVEELVAVDSIRFVFDHQARANGYTSLNHRPTLDYKNITLERIVEDEAEESANEAKVINIGDASVDAGSISTVPTGNGNLYLTVSKRNHSDDGLRIKFNASSDKEETYRAEFMVRASDYDVPAGEVANHRIRFIGTGIDTYNRLQNFTEIWTNMNVDGIVVPAGTKIAELRMVMFGSGMATRGYPFDVDDIKIYKITGGTETLIYSEDFENCELAEYDADTLNIVNSDYGYDVSITAADVVGPGAAFTVNCEEDFVRVTDSANDGEMTLTYADGGITLAPGVYTLTGYFKNTYYAWNAGYVAESSQGYSIDRNCFGIKAELAGDNGFSIKGRNKSVASGWNKYEYKFRLDNETNVTAIKFTMEHKAIKYLNGENVASNLYVRPFTVDFKNVTLEYEPFSDIEGRPTPGIVMMLLLKKKAEGGKPAKPQKVNLVLNGDFSEEPAIVSKLSDVQGSAWVKNDYTDKDGVYHAHNITWNDGYITFSGRTVNTDNFYYKSDIVLQPGDYTLSLDMKTAGKGDTTAVRVGVSGNEGMLFNPGVTSVASLHGKFTKHTVKFSVEVPTPFQLNIFGGPSAKFVEDFCIDNVVLVKEDDSYIGEDVPAEIEDGNYVINGSFSIKPTIVSQISDVKGSAWVKNDGEQDGVYHAHEITWRNGYITLSGRQSSTRNFFYKSDVVLEPGKYELSVDLKSASTQHTAVRVGVSGNAGMLFNPGITHVATVTDTWMTHMVEFEVTEATPFQLNIFGGPHSQFTQSFCIDNVVLKKVQ